MREYKTMSGVGDIRDLIWPGYQPVHLESMNYGYDSREVNIYVELDLEEVILANFVPAESPGIIFQPKTLTLQPHCPGTNNVWETTQLDYLRDVMSQFSSWVPS